MARSSNQKKKGCSCFCWITIFTSLALSGILLWYFVFNQKGEPDPIATCGTCHCIESSTSTCPSVVPKTDYTATEISTLASQVALNPITLSCDPYNDKEPCNTEPPLDVTAGDVCGIHYETAFAADGTSANCSSSSYKLMTYSSDDAAEAAGGFVTHRGACGVCSTTQDLSVYLNITDMKTEAEYCSKQVIMGFQRAVDCFVGLGMTTDCANVWVYNGIDTAKNCFVECIQNIQDVPNNGPAPECKLNDCIKCANDKSGALFEKFAGRTERNSGILTSIARPCDMIDILNQEVCPFTMPLPSLSVSQTEVSVNQTGVSFNRTA
eukprot:scaffold423591_cov126-Attheya_sp.AAC.1